MSLLPKLREFFTTRWSIEPDKPVKPKWHHVEPDFTPYNDVTPVVEVVEQPQGGVRKVQHKQWTLDEKRTGGRIVKTMPRNLRHMKELAEKTDDSA